MKQQLTDCLVCGGNYLAKACPPSDKVCELCLVRLSRKCIVLAQWMPFPFNALGLTKAGWANMQNNWIGAHSK